MKKEEAKKALEQLNNNEPTTKREENKQIMKLQQTKNLELRNNYIIYSF